MGCWVSTNEHSYSQLVDHYIKNGATLENLEIIHSKLRPGTAREYLANIIGVC
jgi:hypothetical protein